jgi:hypothetical protein
MSNLVLPERCYHAANGSAAAAALSTSPSAALAAKGRAVSPNDGHPEEKAMTEDT